MSDLYCNIDCTCFFGTPLDGRVGNTGEAVDVYVDRLAEAGVTDLLVNTNARRTNYRSDVWDAFWDGYDPNGPDTQPFFAAVPAEGVASYRRLLDTMRALHESGVDYPARMLARARHHGMRGWITLRMNDIHHGNVPDHPFHGGFWREHPEYKRQGGDGYFFQALDYAHAQVRDYFAALVKETVNRYDVHGVELDFMREPKLFSYGQEAEGGRILTQWIGELRALVRKTATERGREIKLGVRVPSTPDTARGMGLDAVAWAEDGLVDLIVATPRFRTMEFDMPMAAWRQQLAGTNTELAGGLEVRVQGVPSGTHAQATPAQAKGAAVSVLAGGADGVYLFNYFPSQHPNWSGADYVDTLRAMSSLATLTQGPRSHVLTHRDIVAPGEKYEAPLPATGKALTFSLPTGPKPPEDWQVTLVLGLATPENTAAPAVTVNGECGTHQPADESAAGVPERLRYALPPGALLDASPQEVRVVFAGGESGTVNHVELQVDK
jgi:hypothetical protein